MFVCDKHVAEFMVGKKDRIRIKLDQCRDVTKKHNSLCATSKQVVCLPRQV